MADKQSAAGAGKGGAAPKTTRKTKAKPARKSAPKPNGSSAGGRDLNRSGFAGGSEP